MCRWSFECDKIFLLSFTGQISCLTACIRMGSGSVPNGMFQAFRVLEVVEADSLLYLVLQCTLFHDKLTEAWLDRSRNLTSN